MARNNQTNPEEQGPPKHEDTLAAIHGADPKDAKRYAENPPTGDSGASKRGGDEDEPTFNSQPLSFYDQYETEEQLTELNGVGEATAKHIMQARRKRDRSK